MGRSAIAFWLVLLGIALLPGRVPAEGSAGGFRSGCIGDCNDDRQVTIAEIILSVRIALGESPDTACLNGGPGYSINGLTTAVVNSLSGCVTLRDFSDFTLFTMQQEHYFGFCTLLGDIYSAAIRATDSGWVVEQLVVENGNAEVDECLEDFREGPECLVARPQPCRMLTAAERQRVGAAFEQVQIWTGPDAFCIHGVADPCLVTAMKWDDFVTSDFIHGSARLDGAEVPRIVELIRSLGEGPETPCPEP